MPMLGVHKSFQFVPGLAALHRTAFSPLRYAKAAAEYWRYADVRIDVRTQKRTLGEKLNTQGVRHDRNHSN